MNAYERLTRRPDVTVEVRNRTRTAVNAEAIADLMAEVLAAEGAAPAEVGVALVGEVAIRRLNREHRGLDGVTDVLSFPLEEPGEWDAAETLAAAAVADGESSTAEAPPRLLGDIVVCPRQAARQAAAEGTPPGFELALLLVHGLLHLLGWEHQEQPGPMALRQGELLQHFDWSRLVGP